MFIVTTCFSGKNASRGQDGGDATAADNVQESFAQKMATAKRVRKSDAEFESDVSEPCFSYLERESINHENELALTDSHLRVSEH